MSADGDLSLPEDTSLQFNLDDEDGDEPETTFSLTPEDEALPNLVELMMKSKEGQEALKDISTQVLEEVDSTSENREEYCKRVSNDWKLFAGDLPPKTRPFEHCANMHVPIAIENTTRIVFHAYGELFGDWTNVWGVLPMGPEDDITAQVVSVHGNWQLRQQIPGFKRQQHRGLLAFFYIGDVTCHSYWDPVSQLNCHEILTPDEFITPYSYVTTSPDYADLPWYARVISKYKHELEAMRGDWFDVDSVIDKSKPSWMDEPEHNMAKTANEYHGIHEPDEDKRAPYKLFWYEGWIELPGQEKERFCKVIVDPISRSVLKLQILEMEDWQDKQRFEMQQDQLAQYQEQKQQLEAYTAQADQQVESMSKQHHLAQEVGDQEHQMNMVARLTELGSAPLPPPPTPPAWMLNPDDETEQPDPPRRVPIRLFAHGVCIEPLAGNLGLGYGRILADYNRAGNTLLNQAIDMASLANAKSGIIDDSVEFDQEFSVGPGRMNRTRNSFVGKLSDHIMMFEFGGANPQLFEAVDRIQGYGSKAAQSPEVLSGEPGKSGETYRGLAMRSELATKVLSITTGKYRDFFEQIIKNNALLNSVFLKDEEIFSVANHALRGFPGLAAQFPPPMGGVPGQPPPEAQLSVTKAMYERNYEIEFRCDLRFSSQAQRIAEADEAANMVLMDPMLAANLQLRYYTRKKCFEARGKNDLVSLMGPPPPPGMMPPQPAPSGGGAPGGGPPKGPDNSSAPSPPDGGGEAPQPAQEPQAPPQ